MNRRSALRSAGALLAIGPLAGCTDDGTGIATDGDDGTPLDIAPEQLLLSRERLDDTVREGWSAADPDGVSLVRDAHAANQWVPFDEEAGTFHQESGTVTSGVWVFEEVGRARTAFDESPYRDGWGYEERPIAVEGLGGITDGQSDLRVLFRDANALGALQYENPHVGAADRVSTGLALAAAMHRDWRGD